MDIRVSIDRKTGKATFTRVRTVVDEEELENYQAEMTVDQARAYFEQIDAQGGVVPALDRLDYFARAITATNRVRRLDARFFLVDAEYLSGELGGNGELEDLRWVDLAKVKELPLASITALVCERSAIPRLKRSYLVTTSV
mgnify:CR=1 FL=1